MYQKFSVNHPSWVHIRTMLNFTTKPGKILEPNENADFYNVYPDTPTKFNSQIMIYSGYEKFVNNF